MRDNDLHGSGLRLVNREEGIQLAIDRKASGSGNVKCYIFILSDAQLSSASSTESLKAWPINEITSHLQRHNFDRRTNQGTQRLLCKKIQHWYLQSLAQTINTPMVQQENHSRESFRRTIQDDNIHTLFRIHEWDSRIFVTCEKFMLPWSQGCLQNGHEICFEIKVRFNELP